MQISNVKSFLQLTCSPVLLMPLHVTAPGQCGPGSAHRWSQLSPQRSLSAPSQPVRSTSTSLSWYGLGSLPQLWPSTSASMACRPANSAMPLRRDTKLPDARACRSVVALARPPHLLGALLDGLPLSLQLNEALLDLGGVLAVAPGDAPLQLLCDGPHCRDSEAG